MNVNKMNPPTLQEACDKIEELNEEGGEAYFKGKKGKVMIEEEVVVME